MILKCVCVCVFVYDGDMSVPQFDVKFRIQLLGISSFSFDHVIQEIKLRPSNLVGSTCIY